MTNVPPPPPGDVPPPAGNVPPAGSVPPAGNVPPAASVPPPASGAGAYSAPGPGPSPYAAPPSGGGGPKQGLSLTSFIVGLAGLLILSWIPILGLLAGIAAVVLGFMAKGREPGAPQWMWIVGVIAGFVTILLNLIFSFLFLILPIMLIGSVGTIPTSP
ncbi:hypothetical protein ACFFGH_23345 [Lysobacter korlensis]|uniref:DUF4190 domain-containing protein n=1 Tax=Lysobacter korlensis TaxID=553636 RepID=A0ABV6RVH1_9GAMM